MFDINRKIGIISSIINFCSVALFALSMLLGFTFLSYIASMFIAFSFLPMVCAFAFYSSEDRKIAGYASMVFGGLYTVIILLVYFAQVTTLKNESLNEQATVLLDYTKFSLFFNFDLLGYALMALSSFFAGLTISVNSKADKCLKCLLMIHGIFFISCMILPILGIFNADVQGTDIYGTIALEIWCLYFMPIGILSMFFFKKKQTGN